MNTFDVLNLLILIATVVAIVYGPIRAVKITRNLDDRRERERRRLEVFRALMRTRQVQLNTEHVFALNLIEVDFYQDKEVIAAYRAYMRHLNTALPSVDEQEHFFNERGDYFIDLLHAVGDAVGYKFDKHELSKFGYAPQGWNIDEERQKKIQLMLVEVLEGKRAFTVGSLLGGGASPYPPVPEIERSGS